MTQVLLNFPARQNTLDALVSAFPNASFHHHPYSSLGEAPLSGCEVLATFGTGLEPDLLLKMPRLRLLQLFTSGVDRLPIRELQDMGVTVCNARGLHGISIAEYIFGCMLTLTLNLFTMRENQKAGRWFRKVQREEIYQKTMGIIGTGGIGQEVALKAKAFGMTTLGLNQSGRDLNHFDRVYSPGDIGELLAASDYVLLSLPLTESTRHFMDQNKFALMKPTSCFINISRGRVVNEAALIDALKNKKIKSAILDVFEKEPLSEDSPLWSMENVIVTPHIAGAYPFYIDRVLEIFRHNLSIYLGQGQDYKNPIDLERGY